MTYQKTNETTAENILLTTKDAARLLRISPKTLERMRVEGTGPHFVKIGRCVRYKKSDIFEYIEINTVVSTSQK